MESGALAPVAWPTGALRRLLARPAGQRLVAAGPLVTAPCIAATPGLFQGPAWPPERVRETCESGYPLASPLQIAAGAGGPGRRPALVARAPPRRAPPRAAQRWPAPAGSPPPASPPASRCWRCWSRSRPGSLLAERVATVPWPGWVGGHAGHERHLCAACRPVARRMAVEAAHAESRLPRMPADHAAAQRRHQPAADALGRGQLLVPAAQALGRGPGRRHRQPAVAAPAGHDGAGRAGHRDPGAGAAAVAHRLRRGRHRGRGDAVAGAGAAHPRACALVARAGARQRGRAPTRKAWHFVAKVAAAFRAAAAAGRLGLRDRQLGVQAGHRRRAAGVAGRTCRWAPASAARSAASLPGCCRCRRRGRRHLRGRRRAGHAARTAPDRRRAGARVRLGAAVATNTDNVAQQATSPRLIFGAALAVHALMLVVALATALAFSLIVRPAPAPESKP